MAAPVERPFFASPIAAAGGRVIASPFEFTTDDDDNLQILSVCSVAGVTLTLNGRRVDEKGQIVPFVFQHTPFATRSTRIDSFKFGRGALLNLTVFASAGSPLVGQCYVIVRLIKGLTGATIILGTLLSGYVTATQALGYPGSPLESSTTGEPTIKTIGGTLPAIGAEILETVPTGARWQLVAFSAILICNAVVANRHPRLRFMSNADIVGIVPCFQTMPAGSGEFISWLGNVQGFAPPTTNQMVSTIPDPLWLLAGQTFGTSTLLLQAGDTWNAPIYTVREWLEVS